MKAVVCILGCLVLGQLLHTSSAQPEIAFTGATQEVTVNEEAPDNTAMVCVVLRFIPGPPGSALAAPITANLEFGPAGGGAVAILAPAMDADISVDMMSVTFNAGDMVGVERCITVTGIPDVDSEGREFLGITIDDNTMDYEVDGAGVGFAAFATIVVEDDDAAPTCTLNSATFAGTEGDSFMVCVILTLFEPLIAEVSVELVESDAPGTPDDTNAQLPVLLTFPITSSSGDMQCRTVMLIDDDDVEGTETFTLFLQNPIGGVLGMPNTAIVTITDDDIGTVTLSAVSTSEGEGDDFTIMITLDLPGTGVTLTPALVVTVSTNDGTAVAPGDYAAVNMMEFMFTNEDSETLTVMTSQDAIAEGDETLSVVIDGITGPAVAGPNLPLTITDDDTFQVQIQTGPGGSSDMGTEGGFTTFLICVEAISPGGAATLQNDVIVTLSVDMSGKADASDIEFQVSNEIIISDADRGDCALFNIVNDVLVEGDHTVIFVIESLSSTDGIMINMMMNTHPFTIMDNDGAAAEFTFMPGTIPVVEDDTTVQVCVVLGGLSVTESLGCAITATLDIQGGSLANEGDDYDPPAADLNLVFTVGSVNGEMQCANIDILEDNDYELDHTFTADIMTITPDAIMNNAGTARIEITDDDVPTVSLTSAMVTGTEGDSTFNGVCVQATLGPGGEFEADLTVTLMGTAGTATAADFSLTTSSVTFSGPPSPQCITIDLINDFIIEGDHSFTVDIMSSGGANTEAPTSATVLIEDNDRGAVIISSSPGSITEGMMGDVCVQLQARDGTPTSLDNDLAVSLSTMNGKATGADYNVPNIVISQGGLPMTGCASVMATQDTLVEGDHGFDISISSTGLPDYVTIESPDTTTVTITDDDGIITISFDDTSPTVAEGAGPLTLCAVLDLPDGTMLGCDIEVTFMDLPGNLADTNDYTLMPQMMDTFLENVAADGDMVCVDIVIEDDDIYEADHDFSVQIDLSVSPTLAVTGGTSIVTIQDNSDATVRVTNAMVSASEMTGMTSTVDVCVDPDVDGIELQLIVTLTANDGKAVQGDDFTSPNPLQIVFDPIVSAGPLCATFDILDDTELEGDHSFTVQITGVGPAAVIDISADTATVTIDDDEQGVVMLDASSTVTEGSPATGVCLTVSEGSPAATVLGCDLDIMLTTATGKAGPADFTEGTYTVSFTAGTAFPLSGCVSIPTTEDNILEGDHDFSVSILSATPNDAVTFNPSDTHIVTINDDDGTATFTLQAATSALDEGTSTMCCVAISGLPAGGLGCDIDVQLDVSDMSAVMGEDFSVDPATPTLLTFASGTVTNGDERCIQINIIDDDIYEEQQQFGVSIVSVSLPSAALIGTPNPITKTIQDIEDAVVSFVMDAYDVGEETGSVSICVDSGVTGGFQAELVVTLVAMDGKASLAADTGLGNPQFQVVFPIGHPTQTYCTDIPITSDTELEDNHEFTVEITGAGSAPFAILGTPVITTVTIIDDENGLLTMDPIVTVEEGQNVMVCINLICTGSVLGCPLTVNLETTDSAKAVSGDDFDAGPHSVSFAVGSALPVTSCTTISTTDDPNVEGDHEFIVSIDSFTLPNNVALLDPPVQQTATLTDNDAVTVGFEQDEYTFSGGMGAVSLALEVSGLNAGILECPVNVTIFYTDGPKAINGQDYQPGDLVVTLPAMSTVDGDTFSVDLTILSDDAVEGLHSFMASVEASSLVVPGSDATINIVDNDMAAVEMSEPYYSVGEGDGSVEVCVDLSSLPAGGLECEISVTLDFNDGVKAIAGMDYDGTMIEVVFPISSVQGDSVCANVPILDDDALECEQEFTVFISSATLGTDITGQPEADVSIVDNDSGSLGLDFSMDVYNVDEDAGTVEVCMDLTDLPPGGLECDLVIPLNLVDGKAVAGDDFLPNAALSITFPASSTPDDMNACASIDIVNDDNIECEHSFTVEVGDIMCDVDPPIASASPLATVTIFDEDDIIVSMRDTTLSVDEGIDANVEYLCVVIEIPGGGVVECELTATVSPVAGTANLLPGKEDYVDGVYTIPIPPNSGSLDEFCIDIRDFIIDDHILESNETFDITLQSVTPCGEVGSESNTVVEIIDNDKLQAGFVNSEYSLGEGTQVSICVVLEGYVERPIDDIYVDVKSIIGDDSDYSLTDVPLLFGAGASPTQCILDEQQCFYFVATQDDIKEEEEKFKLSLYTTDPGVCFCSDQAHVVIEEDDTDGVEVSLSVMNDGVVSEDNGAMLVLVTLNGQLEVSVTVTVETVDGSAIDGEDYRALSHEIIFDEDSVNPHRVYIPLLNDICLEYDEYFSMTLTTDMDCVKLVNDEVIINITNDDYAKITLDNSFYEEYEVFGTSELDICVLLKTPIKRNITFHLVYSDISTTVGSDYSLPVNLYGTFVAGSDAGDYYCFTFIILDDPCVEDDEYFSVHLLAFDNDVIIHIVYALVRIVDHDYITVDFQYDSYTVEEGADNVTVCVEITEGCLERYALIGYSTVDGTAQSETDYYEAVGELHFEPGSMQGDLECVDVLLNDDCVKELNESFTFAICPIRDEDVYVEQFLSKVTIVDDDRVTVSLSLGNVAGEVLESNGAMLVLVELEGYLETHVIVTVETYDGSAVAGLDYVPVTQELVFNNYTQSLYRLYIPIINDDDCVEEDEYFSVRITTDMDCVYLAPYDAHITIIDDDIPEISLTSEFFYVYETDVYVFIGIELKSDLKRDIDFYLYVTEVTALADVDFNGTSPIHATFYNGSVAGDRFYIHIPIFDDHVVEDYEYFNVSLSGSDLEIHIETAIVKIIDDDSACVNFTQESYTAFEEDGFVEICVDLEGYIEDYLVVYLFTIPGTASADNDFVPLIETLVFHDSGELCANVTLVMGDSAEDIEKFSVALTSQDERLEVKEYYVPVYIIDSDVVRVGFSQNEYSVVEDDGNGNGNEVEICINLSGTLERDVTVYLTTSSGSAIGGVDYSEVLAQLTSFQFLFESRKRSVSSNEQCINVTIMSDDIVEDDEVFYALLSTDDPLVMLYPNASEITIINNDRAEVTLDNAGRTVNEGDGFVQVCLELTAGDLGIDVTVELNTGSPDDTATAGEDYEAQTNAPFVFAAGSPLGTTVCVNISIVNDDKVEETESFAFDLSSNDPVDISAGNGVVFIVDDDTVTITWQQSIYSVREDQTVVSACAQITAGTLCRDLVVVAETMDSEATPQATSGDDYESNSLSKTYDGDTSVMCIGVTIIDDTLPEDALEFFSLRLSSTDSAVVFTNPYADVAIMNDDIGIAYQEDNYFICEGVSPLTACVDIDGESVDPRTFTLSNTLIGTATEGEDFLSNTQSFTFNTGDPTPCIAFTIVQDPDLENCETFDILISTTDSNVFPSPSTATVTIYDDDGPRIEYIDDTPEVDGINMLAQFELSYCPNVAQTMCQVLASGISFPCLPESPQLFTLFGLGPRNVIITAEGFCGNQYTLSRPVRSDNERCHLHQINGGAEEVEINGNSATAMFEGTGPDEDNGWTEFQIVLQQQVQPGQPYLDLQIINSCDSASPALQPFGVTCSFDASTRRGTVTWIGINTLGPGSYGIHIFPQQRASEPLCDRLFSRRFDFVIST